MKVAQVVQQEVEHPGVAAVGMNECGGESQRFFLTECVLFFLEKMEDVARPVTEETQTPRSCSNRSPTLPQATGKTPMSA